MTHFVCVCVYIYVSGFTGPKAKLQAGEETGSTRTVQCIKGPKCCYHVQLAKGAGILSHTELLH